MLRHCDLSTRLVDGGRGETWQRARAGPRDIQVCMAHGILEVVDQLDVAVVCLGSVVLIGR